METSLALMSTVGDRIGAFIKHLEELLDEDFPTRGSKDFIRLLQKVSLFFNQVLKKQAERIQKYGYEKALENQIKMLADATGNLSMWLEFLEASKSEYTPVELVRIVNALGKKIYINGEIIIRSQPQYSWEFIEIVGEMKKALESFRKTSFTPLDIDGIFENSPDFIAVLSFPDVEKNNLFLHLGLMIHEFGHYFDKINNISADVYIPIDDKKIDELVEIELERIRPKPDDDKIYETKRSFKKFVETRIHDLVKSWVEESIADLISIHIGGTGAFFAFADQAIIEPSLDDYTIDEKYPSFRIRLSKMLDKLKENGFKKETFDEWNKVKEKKDTSEFLERELKKWEETLGSEESEKFKNDIHDKEINLVKESFFKIYSDFSKDVEGKLNEIEENVGGFKFTAEEFDREVFHLLDLIKKDISPNEIILKGDIEIKKKSIPANWASILNAGWLWSLLYLEKPTIYSEEQILERRQKKYNLFLQIIKAIERSEIHKKFLNIKSKFV